MANTSSAKGNPASHRMSNMNLKARRQRCWNNGQARKERNRKLNQMRAAENRILRENGLRTPHEEKKLMRKIKRDRMREAGLIPRNEKEWAEKHKRVLAPAPTKVDKKKA